MSGFGSTNGMNENMGDSFRLRLVFFLTSLISASGTDYVTGEVLSARHYQIRHTGARVWRSTLAPEKRKLSIFGVCSSPHVSTPVIGQYVPVAAGPGWSASDLSEVNSTVDIYCATV